MAFLFSSRLPRIFTFLFIFSLSPPNTYNLPLYGTAQKHLQCTPVSHTTVPTAHILTSNCLIRDGVLASESQTKDSNGYIACADPSMDHSRACRSRVAPLPRDWNRRSGRPRQTWLCTFKSDIATLNIGLAVIENKIDMHGGRSWKRLVHWISHMMMMMMMITFDTNNILK